MDTRNAALDQNYDSNSRSVENVSKFEQKRTHCAAQSKAFNRFKKVFAASAIERLKKFDGLLKTKMINFLTPKTSRKNI